MIVRRAPSALHVGILTMAVAFAFSGATARADGELRVDITSVDDTQAPVAAVVTVIGGDGRPVVSLKPDQLRVEENGRPARPVALRPAVDSNIGIGVVLVVDTSASMAGAGLGQAREAAKAFVASLSPNDQAAIIAFSSDVRVVQPMTADREALRGALDGLAAVGSTALYAAVDEAVRQAVSSPFQRRVVILLSDGEDYGGISTVTRQAVLGAATASGVPVYAIGVGAGIDQSFLSDLAQRTRGQLLVAPSPGDVAAAYAELTTLLRSQYVLTFESDTPFQDRQRNLKVRVLTFLGSGETMFAYESRRPLPQPAHAAPAPPTDGSRQPAGDASSGPALRWPVVAAAAALVGLAAVGAFAWRAKSRSSGAPVAGSAETPRLERQRTRKASLDCRALLTVMDGPVAGMAVEVRPGDLATLGRSASCALRLPAADGAVAEEHARVWWRDEKLMAHHVAREQSTFVAGRRLTWASLQTGDVIELGPYRLLVDIAQTEALTSPS